MLEIRRILCPVDLSDVSRHAIDHAVLVARWYEATITAVHVSNPIVIPGIDLTLVESLPSRILTEDETKALREQVAACFASAKGISVDVRVGSGHPARQIVEIAASLPADLIVMGTHGAGGFQHLVLGSVTEKVLRTTTRPVLVVPPRARTTSKLPFQRILCPVDFSDCSLAALEFAFSLAQESQAALTIVHVLESPESDALTRPPFGVPEYRQALEHDASTRLDALVPESVRAWCSPTTRLLHGKPYREILQAAAEDSSDLIVMGVHGRNALDLMLFGSTTNQVVRRATCPVVTWRQSADGGAS